ncbi:HAD family hydrolase [Prochlorococcus sp. MIT 1300]|uniref:HAD family hydrolase n=1 Tax=Prochlorococcus sp. MIT 1300 TaxID=3096218 RepID=UPI002A75F154|nr:HAD family hydrolase [Prochlorococcus sp. MIT 1300]
MGLKLLHLNLHGLFRSHDLELGRDADTGGQTLYVLELLKGLASRPEVEQVDLVTRLIQDRKVSAEYSNPKEVVAPGASIIRLPFGPKRYLRKELLWPYLDDLADQLFDLYKQEEKRPDWIHAHYADAGYVAALVSRRLGIPMAFTGHSLGREKQRRLLEAGVDHEQIEQTYSISRRIDAEEVALAHSDLVITSTQHEADYQYSRYGRFQPERTVVVPPGVDSRRFYPSQKTVDTDEVNEILSPFLRKPELPPLLAISRAVRRKNIPALVEAYGRSSVLRQRHNLVLILGCREDPRQLEKQQREVFQQIFDLVDRYDLYGQVAYPKQHRRDQIPYFYSWARNRKGLFVNPALTEPFGLTLLEAAACGLPTVATDDGGPRDILARCQNGLLVDVTDLESLQDALEQAGSDRDQWRKWSDNGIEAISRHFSWDAHVCNYLALMQKNLEAEHRPSPVVLEQTVTNPLGDHLLLLDLDSNMELPEGEELIALRNNLEALNSHQSNKLGVLTGRSIKLARSRYSDLHLPEPSVWITSAGTEIYYGQEESFDNLWKDSIATDWDRNGVENALLDLKDHLVLQNQEHQTPYKVSYLLKEPGDSILPLVRKRLRVNHQVARPYLRCHWYLDVIPLRASRTEAIRHLVLRWGVPLEQVFVVASQQGDAELLRGLTNTLVPPIHDPSLESLKSQQRVFFASNTRSSGLIDGLNHYRLFSSR